MVRFCWIGMFFGLLLAPMAMAADKAETVKTMTITLSTPTLQIDVRYPELGIKSADDDIAEWANQLVETFKQDYGSEERPQELPEDRPGERPQELPQEHPEVAPAVPYTLNVGYSILQPSPAALSVVWEVSDYTGGAHGNLYISTTNYSLPQGRVIAFDTMFRQPQAALEILSTLSRNQLGEQLGDMRVEDMLRAGTEPKAENFANIALTPSGIRLYFSPYEVAPWAAGPQQVDIPLEALRQAEPQLALWGK